jgi:predicted DNA-binding transcriptional regulator AlpA
MENEKGPKSITPKQERTIRAVLESRSIEEACKVAGISKSLFYKWMTSSYGP